MDLPSERPVTTIRSRIAGRIAYRDADGRETGRERFELLHHDGGTNFRALCEMDDEALLRDVTMALDRDNRPIDGFCRILRSGRPHAALCFAIDGRQVDVAGRVEGGPFQQMRLSAPAPIDYLGLHPLQGDALVVAHRGDSEPGRFLPVRSVTNSVSPNGDEACGAALLSIEVAFQGIEDLDVTAGRFRARRFALRWRDDWPPADLWVREQDCVFLKMQWAQVETRYELIDIEETQP